MKIKITQTTAAYQHRPSALMAKNVCEGLNVELVVDEQLVWRLKYTFVI